MGYGIIQLNGNKMQLVTVGVIKLAKLGSHPARLKRIFERVLGLIDEFHPDELAIEAPFFGKNVQSMLKLGRAQGVAMAAGLYREVPIFEYAPKRIKQAITGRGAATKEQVAGMLASILNTNDLPNQHDATDGLAAAVCHAFQKDTAVGGKSYSGWNAFLKDNPDRLG